METLTERITKLKAGRTLAQLKIEDKKLYYKVKNLSCKLAAEKEVTFKTAKDFLTANKKLVLDILFEAFWGQKIDKMQIAKDYFEYITRSEYNEAFSCPVQKNKIETCIKYSVQDFKKQLNTAFSTDLKQ